MCRSDPNKKQVLILHMENRSLQPGTKSQISFRCCETDVDLVPYLTREPDLIDHNSRILKYSQMKTGFFFFLRSAFDIDDSEEKKVQSTAQQTKEPEVRSENEEGEKKKK